MRLFAAALALSAFPALAQSRQKLNIEPPLLKTGLWEKTFYNEDEEKRDQSA